MWGLPRLEIIWSKDGQIVVKSHSAHKKIRSKLSKNSSKSIEYIIHLALMHIVSGRFLRSFVGIAIYRAYSSKYLS